jgi:hypothetical protein
VEKKREKEKERKKSGWLGRVKMVFQYQIILDA